MVDPSRRQFLLGSALLATLAAARAASPQPVAPIISADGLEGAIPQNIGNWRFVSRTGLILPPRDETEVRTYDQVLARVYEKPDSDPIMIMIAYGARQDSLFEIHRPEACYPAQGYRLSNRREVSFPVGRHAIPATFWTATSDTHVEQMLYWTRIGDEFPRNWVENHLAVIRANLARRLPDGVLVRVSMVTNDAEHAISQIRSFTLELLQRLSPVGRKLLIDTI
jgi:EpsI family protein